MMMSIYERTKEIGVMKVLGCDMGNIRSMFLIESGFIVVNIHPVEYIDQPKQQRDSAQRSDKMGKSVGYLFSLGYVCGQAIGIQGYECTKECIREK